MVDINLIGDDNIGEEKTEDKSEENSIESDQVDELSQTHSMETHELAFEERTETFDTTRTAAFSRGAGYSSSLRILMIAGGVVVVAGLLWLFVLRDDPAGDPAQVADATPIAQDASQPELGATQQPDTEGSVEGQAGEPVSPAATGAERSTADAEAGLSPSTPAPADIVSNVSSDYFSESVLAIKSVTEVLGTVGADLNTSLLSYAGQKIRYEFIGSTQLSSGDIASELNQRFGSTDFSVLSERDVTIDGQALKKVLISGTASNFGIGNGQVSGTVESWDVSRIESWLRARADQSGLEIRQLKSQQGRMADGYMKRPLVMRLLGDGASLSNFMEALSDQKINVEMAKILVLSPAAASFGDQSLLLVLNMFVYE
jgi:hypothetical protein